ncbi:MAG: hypothetical protein WC451_05585 [Patescibacteria group bacterium]|jgi:phosphatidylethanolamine-binding protein (PEBP) family uncharacterized protein
MTKPYIRNPVTRSHTIYVMIKNKKISIHFSNVPNGKQTLTIVIEDINAINTKNRHTIMVLLNFIQHDYYS